LYAVSLAFTVPLTQTVNAFALTVVDPCTVPNLLSYTIGLSTTTMSSYEINSAEQ